MKIWLGRKLKQVREIISDILCCLMLVIGMFISELRERNGYVHMKSVDKTHVGNTCNVEEELIFSHFVTLSLD